ncbi:hypothetical protein K8R42_04260 [bacterium]|nr:hypothetical protein [bacterium]
MFITPHTSAALWISTKVNDPILAFFCAVISHIILDIIPHGDDNLGDHKVSKRAKFFYELKIASVDVVFACLLIYGYVITHPNIDGWVLFAAVSGAWLPDLSWVAIETFKINVLYWYTIYHNKLHNFFNWQYSIVYGVPFQIAVTLLLIKISF